MRSTRIARFTQPLASCMRTCMHTLAFISQKGDAGKTALTVNTAIAFQQTGHKPAVIIDLDLQASAATWGRLRQVGWPFVVSGLAPQLDQALENTRTHGAAITILGYRAPRTSRLPRRRPDHGPGAHSLPARSLRPPHRRCLP